MNSSASFFASKQYSELSVVARNKALDSRPSIYVSDLACDELHDQKGIGELQNPQMNSRQARLSSRQTTTLKNL